MLDIDWHTVRETIEVKSIKMVHHLASSSIAVLVQSEPTSSQLQGIKGKHDGSAVVVPYTHFCPLGANTVE